jgi:lysozyme
MSITISDGLRQQLKKQLQRDEGVVLHVYLDSKKIRTAGTGHNLEAHGIDLPVGAPITQDQNDEWLDGDIDDVLQHLDAKLPWVTSLDDARLGAVLNMAFNMGIGDGQHGLTSFHHFLGFLQAGDWNNAAAAAEASGWYHQVGPRAHRLCAQIRLGTWF